MGGASSDEQEQSDEKEYERPERYSSKAVVPEEESSDEGELDDDVSNRGVFVRCFWFISFKRTRIFVYDFTAQGLPEIGNNIKSSP